MLAVHPDYRNQGVATKLIYTVAGCFEPEDEISVVMHGDDEQAQALKGFYHSCGFEEEEEQKELTQEETEKQEKMEIKILNKIKIIYIILTYQSRHFVIQDKI